MVHKWLLKKAREKILTGLIFFLIIGPIWYHFAWNYFRGDYFANLLKDWDPWRCFTVSCRGGPMTLEVVEHMIKSIGLMGVGIGFIGIIFLIFSSVYLLITVILEYMKKRRYSHISKI